MNRTFFRTTIFILAAFLCAALFPRYARANGGFIEVGLAKHERVSGAAVDSRVINVYGDVYGMPLAALESGSGFTVSPSGGGAAIYRGGELLYASEGAVFIQGAEGTTSIGGISYRGFLKVQRAGASVTVVNVIDMEQYLCGVVPAEMPSSWHPEALKAQAVAARTYAVTQSGVHSERGFGLCDTTCCQYYPGMSKESAAASEAVNQTAGIMAYYNGEPINTVFSSSSGGRTESSENVWSEALPYLRGVQEIHENEFLTWTRRYTLSELGEGLAAKGINVGSLTGITARYFPSGRLAKLTFTGTGGSRTVEKDAIRGITSELDGSLPSTLFKINGSAWSQNGVWDGGSASGGSASGSSASGSIASGSVYVMGSSGAAQKSAAEIYAEASSGSPVKLSGAFSAQGSGSSAVYGVSADSVLASGEGVITITSPTVVFDGRGYGHGVGMSQHGAKGMAEAGYDFVRILQHYYTGIEVR